MPPRPSGSTGEHRARRRVSVRRSSPPAGERARIAALACAILALYGGGALIVVLYAPHHAALAGTAVLALTLGLRHAFDADHIAAIDNTTRKLRQQGQRPLAVGFFFSLGHSTVVLALALVVGLLTHAVPDISGSTGFIGAGVSGAFLWAIGLINLAVLLDVVRLARRARRGECTEAELEGMVVPGGLLMRLGLDRVLRLVTRSWHMFPVGLLFGLGFDTATEFAVLALGANAAGTGVPFLAVLALPVLFAAGMSTMDTIDGIVMTYAYDWALKQPLRKLFYNLTITSLSVLVALLVGSVQLLNVAIRELHLHGRFWDWIAGLDFQTVGYAMAGIFVGTWLLSLLAWRVFDLERRWSVEPAGSLGTGVDRAPW